MALQFYAWLFPPTLTPPSNALTLISRHAGEDKKVDETEFQFLLRGPRIMTDDNPLNAWLPDSAWQALQVLWLGSLLPRLLTTPSGSQRLPTAPNSSLRLEMHAVARFQ